MDDTTKFFAWWGGILSTIVFLWDIYKWWTAGRPKLRLSIETAKSGSKKYIRATVTNYGERPTTIKVFCYQYFKSFWSQLLKRPDKELLIPLAEAGKLPFELKPGGIWGGTYTGPDILPTESGKLYFLAYHSLSKKPVKTRFVTEK